MAKKKPKVTPSKSKDKPLILRFISDPGHGWVEVPCALCRKLGLGDDFPQRGKFFYLEEDDEATQLDRALKRHKAQATFVGHEVDDFEHWFSGEQWPYIPAAVYAEDRELVVYALESMATQMKQLCADATYSQAERSMWRKQWEDCQQLALMFSTMLGED